MSLSATDVLRANNQDFIDQIERARQAASALLESEQAGPWSGSEFIDAIREIAGTNPGPAMYVEDEFIRRGKLYLQAGRLVVADRVSPDDH